VVPYDRLVEVPKVPGVFRMKNLVIYYLDGKWYGEEATYKRSGSGFYSEYTRIAVPQSKAEIERFAAEHQYKIEWRGEIPEEAAPGGVAVH
jgi:hypothetical protein